MVIIDIIANRKSYFFTKEVKTINLRLSGDLDLLEEKNKVIFCLDNKTFHLTSSKDLYILGNEIKGKRENEIIPTVSKYIIESESFKLIPFNGVIEIELIKSVFLIYGWLDLLFKSPYDQRIESLIYNQFLVDLTNKIEPQKDIYFIDKKYDDKKYHHFINRLIDLNLLAKITITSQGQNYNSYYIPLTKPGIGKEEFKTVGDEKGEKTHELWKRILFERDQRLTNWIKNRY
ncbi:hypothetical protein [Flavobacterium tistrianum]|uniref:hypothetical protein n=1 Tax=Flavobacterium tistrianum TaxID=1685414 RepID=UPI000DAC9690|nr:hypothetical protein [Flavobacterium tistrianum]KAF2340799.1 hypothetical protein DMB71_10500 [Flavobacterium tistrianum]